MTVKPKKILVIRLGAIGDVVHSTIIPQSIKEKYPDVQVDYLTANFITPLLAENPCITNVISFDMKKKNNYFYLLWLGLKLRKEKYDTVINLTNSIRNIFLLKIINPKNIYKRSTERVHAVDAFFNTAKVVFSDIEKPVNLHVYVPENIKSKIIEKISQYPRPYIVFSPGGDNDSERQGRIWVDEYWIELGNKLNEKYGGTVFICGSKSEQPLHEVYKNINNSVLMSGELSLIESAALFSLANVFISGDSGPLHIASGLGINTLGIMGSTPALSCSPYGEHGYTVEPFGDCKSCGKKICIKLSDGEKFTPCMYTIKPEIILSFIENNKLL